MGATKWGESFLKSGLPLEHFTKVALESAGWSISEHWEYERLNRDKNSEWFEIDLEATSEIAHRHCELSFIIECKYHDTSRFWFFLPRKQERFQFNSFVFNTGPFHSLVEPRSNSVFGLGPISTWGLVVSEDGVKQENAVYKACEQLAHAFVPYCLFRFYLYNLDVNEPAFPIQTAVLPVVVTNASLYRLKESVTDLDVIRKAKSPDIVADSVPWTWYYYDSRMSLFLDNKQAIETFKEENLDVLAKYPYFLTEIESLKGGPHWIAIVNYGELESFARTLSAHFKCLKCKTAKQLLSYRKRRAHA